MTIENTYQYIAGWLNSCISDSQIKVCIDCAYDYLVNRYGEKAEPYYLKIKEAAELKKIIPNHKLELPKPQPVNY